MIFCLYIAEANVIDECERKEENKNARRDTNLKKEGKERKEKIN